MSLLLLELALTLGVSIEVIYVKVPLLCRLLLNSLSVIIVLSCLDSGLSQRLPVLYTFITAFIICLGTQSLHRLACSQY